MDIFRRMTGLSGMKSTPPVPGRDGYVAAAAPRAEAHGMIDAALEALWTTAPVMAWAGALQQHLRRALDGRGPEAEAAVVVALAERATHVRRHPPAEHPQLWWSYVQNLVQLLRSEPVLRQADFEALLEQMIDERG
jgi:hypothetical protein